jgi:hypothetical protein
MDTFKQHLNHFIQHVMMVNWSIPFADEVRAESFTLINMCPFVQNFSLLCQVSILLFFIKKHLCSYLMMNLASERLLPHFNKHCIQFWWTICCVPVLKLYSKEFDVITSVLVYTHHSPKSLLAFYIVSEAPWIICFTIKVKAIISICNITLLHQHVKNKIVPYINNKLITTY